MDSSQDKVLREAIDALQQLLKAYNSVLPGAKHIAIQDYQILNEAPIAAQTAIRKYEEMGGER